MKNKLNFENFLSTLMNTNRTLDFFVDWDKCLKNRDEISICLNHLNFLLGATIDELKAKIDKLFNEYPKAFSVLNILIAVRDKDEKILNSKNQVCAMSDYFCTSQRVYEFICQSGLDKIFSESKIKDLNDFVFGIEVGLDTNARKNRSGTNMENFLRKEFENAKLNFKEQVSITKFKDLYATFGADIKRFDFVIFAQQSTYFLETNFYTSGGSKLNEVARSYQELAVKFENFKNYEFIWITDGKGWISAKSKLAEAYKIVEIYNLSNLNEFISKVKNG